MLLFTPNRAFPQMRVGDPHNLERCGVRHHGVVPTLGTTAEQIDPEKWVLVLIETKMGTDLVSFRGVELWAIRISEVTSR